jgi:hypothetical protein
MMIKAFFKYFHSDLDNAIGFLYYDKFVRARYCNARMQANGILALFGISMLQPVIRLIRTSKTKGITWDSIHDLNRFIPCLTTCVVPSPCLCRLLESCNRQINSYRRPAVARPPTLSPSPRRARAPDEMIATVQYHRQ